ncbi:5-formyltetrahydrofolate cyclo-ligase [Oceanospirillum beijerinckii]|uniref:5-formyltetrahydrofolate cyclo-ligase n=1 Tax=Oceanospirillum beijerinckii TaxID=64976 RepID=UPI000409FF94|nr:5-formyltetrahydrofolate cyclo-ligase [Oceanospirillum beijerinckii]
MTDTLHLNRNQLRREMRHRRRALTPAQQKQAALSLRSQLLKIPQFLRAKRIAVYLPNDGEIDPSLLIEQARKMGKTCYLPVLQPLVVNRLWFVRYDHKTPMTHNRFGIPEPRIKRFADNARNRSKASDLDLVLLPLVAFDEQGGRMGMGGGFYDRTFAFTRHKCSAKPALIGLAHECQKVAELPIASWDIPLAGVVTDKALYLTP